MAKIMQNKLKEHRRQRMYEYQLDLGKKNRSKKQQMRNLNSRPVTARDKLDMRKFLATKYSYSVERTEIFKRFMNLLVAGQSSVYQALQRE